MEYGIDYLRIMGGSPFDEKGRERARIDEAISFIEKRPKDQPFFLNLWLMAMHAPIDPPKSFIEQFANVTVRKDDFGKHMQANFDRLGKDVDRTMRVFLAELLAMDVQIGRLLDKLDELGIANNTVVIFTSDNGPARVERAPNSLGYAGGLRGGKHTYFEGGTRVPLVVRWPGNVPAGRVDNKSVLSALDLFTTISSIAGAPYNAAIVEGEDMSDVFRGKTRSRTEPLFFRDPFENGPVFVRYRQWKWHDNTCELYDLDTDPFELSNIVEKKPEVAIELRRAADAWVKTLPKKYAKKADDPLPFDPKAPVKHVDLPKFTDNAMPASQGNSGAFSQCKSAGRPNGAGM